MPFKMGFTNKVTRIVGTVGFILTSFVVLAFGSESAAVATVTIEKNSNLGIIKGVVRDEGGSPIAEASVAIFRNGTSKLLKQVTSNRDGSFLVSRWGYGKSVPCLRAVGDLLRQIGGAV